MPPTATPSGHRWATGLRRGAWAVLAVMAAVPVLLISSVTQGACYDSGTDPDASYCTSGPMLTEPGVWIMWVAWVLFAAYCLYRIVRPRRR